ncbi:Glycerol kinase [Fasciola gigantica]|uniref:glycerol kinase n=1 Tax=Fasciola gigantica TaxID=46835 RepID=A0A504YZW8_FASGI|nr:Glycerol kinase [Fasciola gigantica]
MSADKQESLVVSIDQGTSSSRVIVFSTQTGQVVALHQISLTPSYPAPGWIEQDANQLYDTTLKCLNECAKQIEDQGKDLSSIVSLGVTNQRETTIAWDRVTGQPLAPAIVWSDARTADLVKKYTSMTPAQNPNAFQAITGLPIHSYFSALKLCWLLENNVDVVEANENGTLLAGTVDCWIIWRLTQGKSHVTDVTNASRTMLMNLNTLDWDPNLCRFFKINPMILPQVVSSSECVGVIQDPACKMGPVKIAGILGDQQASLVGQTWSSTNGITDTARSLGPTVKVTYGTGAFMLWDIGTSPFFSRNGILTTVAYKMGPKSQAHYALEGSVSFAGATINWLRNKLSLFSDYEELETLAQETYKNHQENAQDPCYLVPAFSGLFCPWWQETARATVTGLTADVDRGAFIYAAIRSSAYQTYDVLRAATLAEDSSPVRASTLTKPREIVVDGGMANSTILMQSLADILDMIVRRHNHSEMMTALGAAIAAALAVGVNPTGLLKLREFTQTEGQPPHYFSPRITSYQRQIMLTGWHAAVQRSLGWTEDSTPTETEDSLLSLLRNINKNKRLSHSTMSKKAECRVS